MLVPRLSSSDQKWILLVEPFPGHLQLVIILYRSWTQSMPPLLYWITSGSPHTSFLEFGTRFFHQQHVYKQHKVAFRPMTNSQVLSNDICRYFKISIFKFGIQIIYSKNWPIFGENIRNSWCIERVKNIQSRKISFQFCDLTSVIWKQRCKYSYLTKLTDFWENVQKFA